MTVTISPDDPRSVRALAVLVTAERSRAFARIHQF